MLYLSLSFAIGFDGTVKDIEQKRSLKLTSADYTEHYLSLFFATAFDVAMKETESTPWRCMLHVVSRFFSLA